MFFPLLQITNYHFYLGEHKFGPLVSDGQIWQEQRKFVVRNLSDLGMGKRDTMEDVIEQEAEQLAETWKKTKGSPIKSRVIYYLVKCCY